MNVFSTKVHGFLDYLMGLILLVAPSLLSLDKNTTEAMVFYTLGVILLSYSILTNYELGMLKGIPMKAHLALDVLAGIFLATSPWIFGFENQIIMPYIALGAALFIAGITTTSRVGVPEIQEIVPTDVEIVQPHIAKTSPVGTKAKATGHSITETKKAAVKKTKSVAEKKPAKPNIAISHPKKATPNTEKPSGKGNVKTGTKKLGDTNMRAQK